jgi:hypothetical protein
MSYDECFCIVANYKLSRYPTLEQTKMCANAILKYDSLLKLFLGLHYRSYSLKTQKIVLPSPSNYEYPVPQQDMSHNECISIVSDYILSSALTPEQTNLCAKALGVWFTSSKSATNS